jgi:ribosomal protein S18 acetylase RimI-like enzyme
VAADGPKSAIRKARLDDVPSLADVLAQAFEDDPVTRSHFPEGVDRVAPMRRFFAFALEHLFIPSGLTFTTDDLAGVAAWLPPSTDGDDDDDVAPVIEEIFGESAWMVLAILRVQAENHPTEPHYYLQFMGTRPQLQRRGVGSRLLGPVLELSDCDQIAAYLDASSEGSRDFYARHGFAVLRQLDLPTGAMFWQMRRTPTRPNRR